MRRVAWIGALLAVACGPSIEFEEASETSGAPDGTSTRGTMPPPPVTTTGDPADDEDVGEDGWTPDWGSVGVTCRPIDLFTCSDGVDCDEYACGDPMSPFDMHGCPRRSCPCDGDEVCFRPVDVGGCAPSEIFCMGEPCVCGFTGDCDGSYCLPSEEVPVPPCFGFEHPEACVAAECAWLEGTRMQIQGSTCTCGPGSGLCVQPSEYIFGLDPVVVYRVDAPTIGLILAAQPEPMPLGLVSCDGPDPGIVCECAGPLGCV
jgi:hypothetical protein